MVALENNKAEIKKTVSKNQNGVSEIEISGTREFKELISIDFLDFSEICQSINDIFKVIFKDYYGCMPMWQNQEMEVLLQFSPGTDNGYGCVTAVELLKARDLSQAKSQAEKFILVNQSMSNPLADQYGLTEDAKDILSNFINPGDRTPWNLRARQEIKNMYGVNNLIKFNVQRLSMDLILPYIYKGDKNKYSYKIQLTQNNMNIGYGNALFEVKRAHNEEVNKAKNKYFAMPLATSNDFVVKAD